MWYASSTRFHLLVTSEGLGKCLRLAVTKFGMVIRMTLATPTAVTLPVTLANMESGNSKMWEVVRQSDNSVAGTFRERLEASTTAWAMGEWYPWDRFYTRYVESPKVVEVNV